jgi:hypothetical protein
LRFLYFTGKDQKIQANSRQIESKRDTETSAATDTNMNPNDNLNNDQELDPQPVSSALENDQQ